MTAIISSTQEAKAGRRSLQEFGVILGNIVRPHLKMETNLKVYGAIYCMVHA